MIDLDFIERLIKVFDESGVDSLEIERGGSRIKLAKTPPAASGPVVLSHGAAAPMATPAPQAAPAPAAEAPRPAERVSTPGRELLEVTSPMVGTFYTSPAPDAPAYVGVGQRVSPGDTLCIIEAMKLMNELISEVSGTIVEVCAQNAQPVEYGQVLFRVDPR
ncbi:MAG: acetyl-CoA carboxylase biotin carboxyl carrier protein [Gemmatimonadetes bacterium]|nr:acetyl-CoA carboxylase biotin carboxyl carrier protein [Gemmatimonadota bacterium]